MDISHPSDSVSLLKEKIDNVRICMFTSLDAHGKLVSQPMTKQQVDDDGCLWFFAANDGALAHNIAQSPAVNISFLDAGDSLYVSASGRASHVDDDEKISQLWSPLVAAWFPDGVNDKRLDLIRVELDSAEYWDSGASKMVQLFKMAEAALGGRPPKIKPGEHGTIYL